MGQELDWSAVFEGLGARRIELPTYAFQRERYWLEVPRGRPSAEHPWLSEVTRLAESEGWLLTGRLSQAEHRWLGDHQVYGRVLVPGTALVELALAAAERVGLDRVEELTVEAPLVLPANGAVELQVTVGAAEEGGRRSISLHSRAEASSVEGGWRRHATGVLSRSAGEASFDLRAWPPPGAEALDLSGLYERLAEAGLGYGPAFQGLKAGWKRGEELFAEVELRPEAGEEHGGYGLHPALFDAALHLLAAGGAGRNLAAVFLVRGGTGGQGGLVAAGPDWGGRGARDVLGRAGRRDGRASGDGRGARGATGERRAAAERVGRG